jgi:hypothetical protein
LSVNSEAGTNGWLDAGVGLHQGTVDLGSQRHALSSLVTKNLISDTVVESSVVNSNVAIHGSVGRTVLGGIDTGITVATASLESWLERSAVVHGVQRTADGRRVAGVESGSVIESIETGVDLN